ncbi:MAG TPA: HAMP domain-containing sensor histidine kinase [Chitinophagaceae bacterium]|nr:HAMP domain-containing sensor histidine kinase [Chitinophagaceae bacterium]
MFKYRFTWRTFLAFAAILIIAATIFYVNTLARNMETEAKKKVQEWVEAYKELQQAPPDANLTLITQIITNNNSIPVIGVNEKDSIIGYSNLDSVRALNDPTYLRQELNLFRSEHAPILEQYNPKINSARHLFYYGDSTLLKEIRYYPFVQLFIVSLFIIVTLIALSSTNKSTQNQLWVGLAKETAHQLGTPLSSMEAWFEMLKERKENEAIVSELHKDLGRLNLITDRFSKIGSIPSLEERELVSQISGIVNYIRKMAPQKVQFSILTHGDNDISAMISPPLFDWVIENLLKNALDAVEGSGNITIEIKNLPATIWIDIMDTGKGIPVSNINKVFKPGFSTKKRGWGLGLSLSKRIIESYHKGRLLVKTTEIGKGTTFRIMLRK